jgi:hypothetical protein
VRGELIMEKIVKTVYLHVEISYIDNINYNFSFVVESNNITHPLSIIAHLIPEENLVSFKVTRSEEIKKPLSQVNLDDEIIETVQTKMNLKNKSLLLSKGDKNE